MRIAKRFMLVIVFVGFVVLLSVFLRLRSAEKSCPWPWWRKVIHCPPKISVSYPAPVPVGREQSGTLAPSAPTPAGIVQEDFFPITKYALPTETSTSPTSHCCLCDNKQFTRLNLSEFRQTFRQPPQNLVNSFMTEYIVDKYTIVIPTYKRTSGLTDILDHYCNATNVHKVLFIWHNVGQSVPETLTNYTKCQIPFKILIPGHNLLSDRFKLTPDIETEAIFTLDDDTIVPYEGLQLGFQTWQAYKYLMVGFEGARHTLTNGHYKYETDQVEQQCYSIVLTGITFLHRKYLEMYFAEPIRRIFDYVDNFTNGEDLLMNAIVSDYLSQFDSNYSCHGVLVSGTRRELQKHEPEYEGLWRRPTFWKERDDCLDLIAEVYNRLPYQCCHYIIKH